MAERKNPESSSGTGGRKDLRVTVWLEEGEGLEVIVWLEEKILKAAVGPEAGKI